MIWFNDFIGQVAAVARSVLSTVIIVAAFLVILRFIFKYVKKQKVSIPNPFVDTDTDERDFGNKREKKSKTLFLYARYVGGKIPYKGKILESLELNRDAFHYVVGRSFSADLQIPLWLVHNHNEEFRISRADNDYYVMTEHKNIFLLRGNGQRMTPGKKYKLEPGDKIQSKDVTYFIGTKKDKAKKFEFSTWS